MAKLTLRIVGDDHGIYMALQDFNPLPGRFQ